MPLIHTVLGAVAPELIGPTDCHDHLFIEGGVPVLHYPDFRLVDYARIAADTIAFRQAGGSAVVEMSPIDWGRGVEQLVRLSRESGVHVIAATGFHKSFYYPDNHWIYRYTEDEIVRLVVAELTEGIDTCDYGGPLVRRSEARAGVIKVGTQTGRFSKIEEKLLHVAARAHLATGAPIMTHTDEGALALEQVEYLGRLGVRPEHIGLSHLDRRIDAGYHAELASTGAYLEYDALTRVSKGFDVSTLDLVVKMAAAGFVNRVVLGGDISRQSYWSSYGGEPGLAFLVGPFRERLAAAGLTEADVHALYVGNPRALLAWSEPGSSRPQ